MNETQLPQDNFSRTLANWKDYPQATKVRPSVVQTTTMLGHTETWTVQTIRHPELGESVFLQRISADGQLQIAMPPKVVETIARQRDQATAANRRRGARQAVETKRENGVPVGNPDALRKARRRRQR